MFGTGLLPDVTVPVMAPDPPVGMEVDVDVLVLDVRGAAAPLVAAKRAPSCSTTAAEAKNSNREALRRCRQPPPAGVTAATSELVRPICPVSPPRTTGFYGPTGS